MINGFMFASEPVRYAFGHDFFDTVAHLERLRADAPDAPAGEATLSNSPTVKPVPAEPEAAVAQVSERRTEAFNPIREKQKTKLQYSRVPSDISIKTYEAAVPAYLPYKPAVSIPAPHRARVRRQLVRLSNYFAYGGNQNGFGLSHPHGEQRRY